MSNDIRCRFAYAGVFPLEIDVVLSSYEGTTVVEIEEIYDQGKAITFDNPEFAFQLLRSLFVVGSGSRLIHLL